MKDKHFTSRMLTCAGALMTVSALLMAVGTGIAYGGIFLAAASCTNSTSHAAKSAQTRPFSAGQEALRGWRKTPGRRPLPGWTGPHPFLLIEMLQGYWNLQSHTL